MSSVFFKDSLDIVYTMSKNAPLIIIISVFFFSFLSGTFIKAFIYFFIILALTFIRSWFIPMTELAPMCKQMFNSYDVTYSTFILCFSLMYFLVPMIMVSTENKINDVNYGVLAVFMAYILLDLFVKKQQDCIPAYFSSIVVANVFCGIILGSLVALCMYVSVMRTYLFINEINPNKEICTTPSTQQFRCSVYKNGELVGSSINS